jgi:hypothetical protein
MSISHCDEFTKNYSWLGPFSTNYVLHLSSSMTQSESFLQPPFCKSRVSRRGCIHVASKALPGTLKSSLCNMVCNALAAHQPWEILAQYGQFQIGESVSSDDF